MRFNKNRKITITDPEMTCFSIIMDKDLDFIEFIGLGKLDKL